MSINYKQIIPTEQEFIERTNGLTQYVIKRNNITIISFVQGPGAYNHDNSEWEMWDYRNEDRPIGYLKQENLDEYFKKNPI